MMPFGGRADGGPASMPRTATIRVSALIADTYRLAIVSASLYKSAAAYKLFSAL